MEVFRLLDLFGRIPDFEAFLITYERYNEQMWEAYRNGKIKKDFMRKERMNLTFLEMGINDSLLVEKANELYVHTAPKMSNLFDDVHEVLDYLKTRYRLYILTNGFTEIQVQKIRNSGLQNYFTKLFMAEMAGYQKPDKRFFEYAVKSIHAHKKDCLMIGDDVGADIRGAMNAGIDQVFFNRQKKKTDVVPTYEINSIKELRDIL